MIIRAILAFCLGFALTWGFMGLAHSQELGGSPWPQMPPQQYTHAYHGKLTVHYGTKEQLYQWCHGPARACAQPRGSSCTIWLPSPTPGGAPEIYAALRAHEIAHCNGWVHR